MDEEKERLAQQERDRIQREEVERETAAFAAMQLKDEEEAARVQE